MIKGVNLGNWLVLEKWMSPDLFAGTEAEDETQLCSDLDDVAKRERLTVHRDSYVTERDFAYLANRHIDAVRIPVPFFVFGDYPPYLGCAEYLDRAGLTPAAGRLLMPDDDRPGAPLVAVITHAYWDRTFQRSPSAIGATLLFEGHPVTVVGVTPSGIHGRQRRRGRRPDPAVSGHAAIVSGSRRTPSSRQSVQSHHCAACVRCLLRAGTRTPQSNLALHGRSVRHAENSSEKA